MSNIKFTVFLTSIILVLAYCTVHTTNQEKQTCIDSGGEFFENTDATSVCVISKE